MGWQRAVVGDVFAVPCIFCEQPVGEPCIVKGTPYVTRGPHAARIYDARALERATA